MLKLTCAVVAIAICALAAPIAIARQHRRHGTAAATATPIKHLVVIFQENVSFDHYFGTYPFAANPSGEPRFDARPGTPAVNGLLQGVLLTGNPNAANPARLDRSQPLTCDQDHDYKAEQQAFDGGLMDKFVQTTGASSGNDPNGNPVRPEDGHGLLRRQHRHRAVELRAVVRDERQLLQHDLRALDAGRDQPR